MTAKIFRVSDSKSLRAIDCERTGDAQTEELVSNGCRAKAVSRYENDIDFEENSSYQGDHRLMRRFAGFSPYKLFSSVGLVGILAIGVWFVFITNRPPSPSSLIADAYAENRTLEMRIEGAPYVPLHQERGPNSLPDRLDRPSLLKAEAQIAQTLRADPDDVRQLDASGRVSLLEDDQAGVDAAVQTLEKAQRLAPEDASVSIDRASAYLLRGDFLDRTEDYGQAIQILGAVVASHRGGDTAEFNYAIALEKHLLKRQSAQAWQSYLTHYPTSSWAQEARDHLAILRRDIRDQETRSESPLMGVEQVATAFEGPDPREIQQIDARIEEYQELAIKSWIPRFFSAEKFDKKQSTQFKSALAGLSKLLIEQHSDPWLSDLLKANRRSSGVRRAVHLLADSAARIETSDDSRAKDEASEALLLFRSAQVESGAKRAQLVLVLAQQYEHRDGPCESMARALLRDPTLRTYPWIFAQVQLEEGFCASVSDRLALRAAETGMATARAHRFPILILRATATQTGLYSALGDTHRAWTAAANGLRMFWAGNYPTLRGYNALALMDEVNYPLDNWFLEAAILKEAMPLIIGDPRTSMAAVEQARLGDTLMQTGDLEGAASSYRQAERLMSISAPGLQRDALSAETELGFAKIDLSGNRLEEASDRLARIRPLFSRMPDDLLACEYYETSGIAQFHLNHFVAAQNDLTSALHIAEKGLRKVDTDEDRWKWSHQHELTYRTLVELKLRNDPWQALVDWEWYKGAALRDKTSLPLRQIERDRIPSSKKPTLKFLPLNDGVALVSFIVFPRGYAVWVWDQSSVKERWVPIPSSELSSQVIKFMEECSDPGSEDAKLLQEGATLYKELILPIEPWISGQHTLVIETDDKLRLLPVGLLVDSRGKYLSDRFSITFSPGIAYLSQSRKWSGVSAKSDAVVLGNPKVVGWASLPDATDEAKAVASSFDHPYLVVQDVVDQANLSHKIARSEVFHFSGHAEASVASAGLVTGDTTFFLPDQLRLIKQSHLELVVLSACSSSRGTSGFFDDDDSVVRRMMVAGVPVVVASRWKVDSASTALLMKAFYLKLLAGQEPSQALDSATRSVRSVPRFSQPYYWAGFSVFGRN